jgi:hypothetical protein
VVAQRLVDIPDDIPGGVHDALGVAVALPVDDPGDLAPLLAVPVVVEARERFTVWLDLPDVAVAGLGARLSCASALSVKVTAKVRAVDPQDGHGFWSLIRPGSGTEPPHPPHDTVVLGSWSGISHLLGAGSYWG